MLNWHKPGCRKPDIVVADRTPFCCACESIAPGNRILEENASIQPPSLAAPPSAMDLQWPLSVKYLDDEVNDKEVTPSEAFQVEVNPGANETIRTTSGPAGDSKWPIAPSEQVGEEGTQRGPVGATISSMGYRKLCGDRFRLLKVFRGSMDEPIHCELIEHDVNTPSLRYEALSYTWADAEGNKGRNVAIYLGKSWTIAFVTANCHAALQTIRYQKEIEHKGSFVLWVDAICIDQDNSGERTHQVGLMRHIYQNAWRVIIFLGGDLREVLQYNDMAGRGSSLLHHPYFSRVWVIQEIASASTAHVLYFSSYSNTSKKNLFEMDWRSFCEKLRSSNSLSFFGRHSWIFRFPKPNILKRQDLIPLLVDSLGTASSDPRDKVFALLGLIGDANRDGLKADYLLSPQQVFTGLAAYAIIVLGDPSFLKHAGIAATDSNLPSWVPNWKENPEMLFFESIRCAPLVSAGHQNSHRPIVHRQTGALHIVARELGSLEIESMLQPRIKLFHADASHGSWSIASWAELKKGDRIFTLKKLDCPIILRPIQSSLAFHFVGHGKLVPSGDYCRPFSQNEPNEKRVIAWWAAIKDASKLPESICQISRDGFQKTLLDERFKQDLQRHCDSTAKIFEHEIDHWNRRLIVHAQLMFPRKPNGKRGPLEMKDAKRWRSCMDKVYFMAKKNGLDFPEEASIRTLGWRQSNRDQRHVADKKWLEEIGTLMEAQEEFEANVIEHFSHRPMSATVKQWRLPPWLSTWLTESDMSFAQGELSRWTSSLQLKEKDLDKWRPILESGTREHLNTDRKLGPADEMMADEVCLMDKIFRRWAVLMETVKFSQEKSNEERSPEQDIPPVPDDDGWNKIVIV